MPDVFDFAHLAARYGEIGAWHFLTEIEKAAGIQPQYGNADAEARLAYALWLQDNPAQERLAA